MFSLYHTKVNTHTDWKASVSNMIVFGDTVLILVLLHNRHKLRSRCHDVISTHGHRSLPRKIFDMEFFIKKLTNCDVGLIVVHVHVVNLSSGIIKTM